jgi:hypothetical protein
MRAGTRTRTRAGARRACALPLRARTVVRPQLQQGVECREAARRGGAAAVGCARCASGAHAAQQAEAQLARRHAVRLRQRQRERHVAAGRRAHVRHVDGAQPGGGRCGARRAARLRASLRGGRRACDGGIRGAPGRRVGGRARRARWRGGGRRSSTR